MSRLVGLRRTRCFVSPLLFSFSFGLSIIIGRALDFKEAVNTYIVSDMTTGGELVDCLLTSTDWEAIGLVSDWLKSFRIATTEMSTTKKPMLSSSRDTFFTLQRDIKAIIRSLPPNVDRTLRDGLVNAHLKLSTYLSKFDQSEYPLWASCKYFRTESSALLIIETVLDPRLGYDGILQDINEMEPGTDKTQLLEELEKAKASLKAHFISNYASTGKSAFDPIPDATVPNGSPQKLNSRHRRKVKPADPNSELDQFFILCQFDNTCGDDPLEWWAVKRHSYPNLYRMVRDILSIPGMSSINNQY
jgi:hypothetical protein